MSHGKSIFIAGASSEADEVATVIELIRAAGWTVTLDWPERQRNEIEKYGSFRNIPREVKSEIVRDLKNAIRAASFFWWMIPRQKSAGASHEAGFFAGIHDRSAHGFTIVSGDPEPNADIYAYETSKSVAFAEHLEALNFLCRMT